MNVKWLSLELVKNETALTLELIWANDPKKFYYSASSFSFNSKTLPRVPLVDSFSYC